MNAPAWSCKVVAEDGMLRMKFYPSAAHELVMLPSSARALAAKLLLVAEEAENPSSRHYEGEGVENG